MMSKRRMTHGHEFEQARKVVSSWQQPANGPGHPLALVCKHGRNEEEGGKNREGNEGSNEGPNTQVLEVTPD